MEGAVEAITERAYEVLGLGPKDFHPTSLEAQRHMLTECGAFADHLRPFDHNLRKFQEETSEFLKGAGRVLTDAPRARHWQQLEPTQPTAVRATPVGLPPQFEELNDHVLLSHLAANAPLSTRDVVSMGLGEPVELWLQAYEAAKERMSAVEGMRVHYDAARRNIHRLARAVEEGGPDSPEADQLVKAEAHYAPLMRDFEGALTALHEHLWWQVSQAARIKAALAAALHGVHRAACVGALLPPPGLLLQFPLRVLERGEVLRSRLSAPPEGLEHLDQSLSVPASEVVERPPAEYEYTGGVGGQPTKECVMPDEAVAYGLTGLARRASRELGVSSPPAGPQYSEATARPSPEEIKEKQLVARPRPPRPFIPPVPEEVEVWAPPYEPGRTAQRYSGVGAPGRESRLGEEAMRYGLGALARRASEEVPLRGSAVPTGGRLERPDPAEVERLQLVLLEKEQLVAGPAVAQLQRLVQAGERRQLARAKWLEAAHTALDHARHKGLPEHMRDQMSEVRRESGWLGHHVPTAPEYVIAGQRKVPGGGPLQFIKDTLLGTAPPGTEGERHAQHAAAGSYAPHAAAAAPYAPHRPAAEASKGAGEAKPPLPKGPIGVHGTVAGGTTAQDVRASEPPQHGSAFAETREGPVDVSAPLGATAAAAGGAATATTPSGMGPGGGGPGAGGADEGGEGGGGVVVEAIKQMIVEQAGAEALPVAEPEGVTG